MKTTSVVPAIAALSQLLLLTPSNAGTSAPAGPAPTNDGSEIGGGLPAPFGVGVNYMWQQGDYEVTSLRAFAGGYPVPGLGSNAITKLRNDIDEVNLKFDWWAQPWLNFHAIIGRVSGRTDADLAPFISPLLGGINSFKVDYDGLVYGGGLTLAGAYKNLFGSITGNYTWANVNMQDSPGLSLVDPSGIQTLVVTPKIGWRFDRGSAWVGGFYQFTQHTQSGSFNLGPPMGTINFQADVEDKSPWNYIAGAEYKLTDHWFLTAEVGFGHREQVLLGTTYRF